MAEEKCYDIVEEAQEMVKQLCERYPEVLTAVVPSQVVVLGITNQEPPKSKTWAMKISRVKGPIKKLLELAQSHAEYYIECYFMEWKGWSPAYKKLVLLHELAHWPLPEISGLVKHDLEDWSFLCDKFGVCWQERTDLPDILAGPKVEFNQKLVDRRHVRMEKDDAEKAEKEPKG